MDKPPSFVESPFVSLTRVAVPPLIWLSILFNFFLAAINTNVVGVGNAEIIATEIFIIGTGVAVAFAAPGAARNPWNLMLIFQISFLLFLLIWRQPLDVKPIRDAIIMPTFFLLGYWARYLNLVRLVMAACLLVLSVAVIEGAFLERYTEIVNPLEYFIAKGSASADVREYLEVDVFASGIRPNGRFLIDVAWIHRVSSVFLEPVSLGVFGSVAGMIIVAYRSVLRRRTYYFGLSMAWLIIWLADGRLSFGILAACVLARSLFVRLPPKAFVFATPLALFFLIFLHFLNVLPRTGEGVGARLNSTVLTLAKFDVGTMIGLGAPGVFTLDTGLGHIVATQGIIGFLLFWLAPILLTHPRTEPGRLMVAFVSVYFALSLMFTQSMLSIKTAALLWAALGCSVAGNRPAAEFGRLHRRPSKPSGTAGVVGSRPASAALLTRSWPARRSFEPATSVSFLVGAARPYRREIGLDDDKSGS